MRLLHLALAGVLACGLAACSSEEPADRDEAEARSTIIQPGRPGEPNETLDPDTTVQEAPANEADALFVRMMVPHHAQALEMSELAETRAADEQVVAIARRIKGAQGPEIVGMSGWLQAQGIEVPRTLEDLASHEGHTDHEAHGEAMAMHGMLTEEQMAELADARGREFDRLFLAGMIQHHEGAVAMAREEMEAGSDTVALELAAEVAAGQQAEIRRMVDIRRGL